MRVIDLFAYSRVHTISTQGLSLFAWSSNLSVDAGCTIDDPDHSRGVVRLVLDPEAYGGGIATRTVRPGTYVSGRPRDVLEIHTLGDSETVALAHALVFAGQQILNAYGTSEPEIEAPINTTGILKIIGKGCVWTRGAK